MGGLYFSVFVQCHASALILDDKALICDVFGLAYTLLRSYVARRLRLDDRFILYFISMNFLIHDISFFKGEGLISQDMVLVSD